MKYLEVLLVVVMVVAVTESVTDEEVGKTDSNLSGGSKKDGSLSPQESSERDRFFFGG